MKKVSFSRASMSMVFSVCMINGAAYASQENGDSQLRSGDASLDKNRVQSSWKFDSIPHKEDDLVQAIESARICREVLCMQAAQRGDLALVRAIYKAHDKANMGVPLDYHGGRTALMLAARDGQAECVRFLMERESGQKSASGYTALMLAVLNNHPQCVEILLEKEAGIKDKNGNTALMFAVKYANTQCVELLLDRESVDDENNEQQTVYDIIENRINDGDDHDVAQEIKALLDDHREVWKKNKERWFQAVHDDNQKALEELLHKYPAVIGMQNGDGQTALMLAARNGHSDCVALLLDEEAGMRDKDGHTALMLAVMNNNLRCVELLRDKEAGLKGKDGNTALMLAVRDNNLRCVELLCDKEAGLKGKGGNTALMLAVLHNHLGCVNLLLEKEAGQKNYYGYTPLMFAVQHANAQCVELLLGKESLDDKNSSHQTVYDIVKGRIKNSNDRDVAHEIKALLDDHREVWKKNKERWFQAVHDGNKEALADLLHKYPAVIGMRNGDSQTALMLAAKGGHAACVALLRDKEAGMLDEGGVTALMLAAKGGHADCVKLLCEMESGLIGQYGSALMVAAMQGHTDCVALLRDKEAGMKYKDGQTALMLAAKGGHAACVALLRDKEAGMKYQDGSALILAAYGGHADCVALLREKEAGMRDQDGRTALMLAAQRGHTDCVELLIDQESGMKSAQDGCTALMLTAKGGHPDCVALLVDRESGMMDRYENTALIFAVCSRNIPCVKILLEQGYDVDINSIKKALSMAEKMKGQEMIRLLRDAEANLEMISAIVPK